MSMRLLAPLLLLLLWEGASAQGMDMSAEEEEMLEQMGVKGQPMGRKNQEPQAEIFKSDLKHIHCGVCRKMVSIAYPKAKELLEKRFKFKARRKRDTTEFDGEQAVQEYTETLCNPLKEEGEWVGMIDLVEDGDKLKLASQPRHGRCRRECRTVERACEDVLDAADTEFTEILYNSVKEDVALDQVQRLICNRAAGFCKKKKPLLKPREHDEKFEYLTDDEKQMRDMTANLKESGMSGTMYKREDLAGIMDNMKDMMAEAGMDENGSPAMPTGDGEQEAGHSWSKSEL